MKPVLLIAVTLFFSTFCFSQNSFDSELKSLTDLLSERLSKIDSNSKIAVWDLADLNGDISAIGKYIAEDISINLSNKFHMVNRNQLNTILKENQLKSAGFVDQTTMKQLKKLAQVDIIITGTYTMLSNNLKITLQALDSVADIVAATKGNVPLNDDIRDLAGINTQSNRGFNRLVASNEQKNNPGTVAKDCETRNTGNYCFYNGSNREVTVNIQVNEHYAEIVTSFKLGPKESKCVYDYTVGSYYFFAETTRTKSNGFGSVQISDQVDSGNFYVERCSSKTYTIK